MNVLQRALNNIVHDGVVNLPSWAKGGSLAEQLADELRPCPLCAGEVGWHEVGRNLWMPYCNTCHFFGPVANNKPDAAVLWNTRPIEDALRAQLSKANENIDLVGQTDQILISAMEKASAELDKLHARIDELLKAGLSERDRADKLRAEFDRAVASWKREEDAWNAERAQIVLACDMPDDYKDGLPAWINLQFHKMEQDNVDVRLYNTRLEAALNKIAFFFYSPDTKALWIEDVKKIQLIAREVLESGK